jgi:hypothetical protein
MNRKFLSIICLILFVYGPPQAFANTDDSSKSTLTESDALISSASNTEGKTVIVEESPAKATSIHEDITSDSKSPVENSLTAESADLQLETVKRNTEEVPSQSQEPENNATNPQETPVDEKTEVGAQDVDKQQPVIAESQGDNKEDIKNIEAVNETPSEATKGTEDSENLETGTPVQNEVKEDHSEEKTSDPQDVPAAIENSQETATKDDNKEENHDGILGEQGQETENNQEISDNGSLVGLLLGTMGVLVIIIFIGCIYNYRSQMEKYKMAPFTPPSFCPNFIFPRADGRGNIVYPELEINDYRPPLFTEV